MDIPETSSDYVEENFTLDKGAFSEAVGGFIAKSKIMGMRGAHLGCSIHKLSEILTRVAKLEERETLVLSTREVENFCEDRFSVAKPVYAVQKDFMNATKSFGSTELLLMVFKWLKLTRPNPDGIAHSLVVIWGDFMVLEDFVVSLCGRGFKPEEARLVNKKIETLIMPSRVIKFKDTVARCTTSLCITDPFGKMKIGKGTN